MIKAKNLSKKFSDKTAVNDISFEIETGKVTGFLGPNGAGKSTTMRLMLGLDHGGGSTTFDGQRLREYPRPSKVVGILLEAKAFHPTRTARHHLQVLALAGGVPLSRVDEVLDIVGLKSEAKRQPRKFSLGMAQRLGIAAAILGKPKYLLLDEPANGLDPEGIVWLREFLKSYADEGNAVFISSHLLSEMSQLADNVVVIGRGKLIADTSVKELVAGNVRSSVFIRTSKLSQFETILGKKKIVFEKSKDGLKLNGTSTDIVGKLAFDNDIPLLELSTQTGSLEEAFLEITEGSEEYAAKKGKS